MLPSVAPQLFSSSGEDPGPVPQLVGAPQLGEPARAGSGPGGVSARVEQHEHFGFPLGVMAQTTLSPDADTVFSGRELGGTLAVAWHFGRSLGMWARATDGGAHRSAVLSVSTFKEDSCPAACLVLPLPGHCRDVRSTFSFLISPRRLVT